MSERLKQCIPMLEVLVKTKVPALQKKYFKLFHHCILTVVREICLNLLLGNIDLTLFEREKLKKYKAALRKLADPQTSLRVKSKLILGGGSRILKELLPPTLRRLNHG